MRASEFEFCRFDKHIHLREGFDCGVQQLNDFLGKYVSQQQEKHLTTAYVSCKATDDYPKSIYGYYTLSANSISSSEFPENMARRLPSEQAIPTIKLGRLARDIKRTAAGFGKLLIHDALFRAYKVSRNIGILAVDVEPKNDKLVEFYRSYGFL